MRPWCQRAVSRLICEGACSTCKGKGVEFGLAEHFVQCKQAPFEAQNLASAGSPVNQLLSGPLGRIGEQIAHDSMVEEASWGR